MRIEVRINQGRRLVYRCDSRDPFPESALAMFMARLPYEIKRAWLVEKEKKKVEIVVG